MPKRTAITEFLPDPCDLLDVVYDQAASTRENRIYRVPSEGTAGRLYPVVVGDKKRHCPCTGFTVHKHCKHMDRADRFERRAWWLRLLADYSDTDLVAVYAMHEDHLLADNGGAEDIAACEAVVCIQTQRETAQAVAA